MSKSKAIGTKGENAVVAYLKTHGWPDAERRALGGSLDKGDVINTPNVCFQVKAGQAAERASWKTIRNWLVATEIQAARCGPDVLPVLVVKRAGKGDQSVALWRAVMPGWAVANLFSRVTPFPPGSLVPVEFDLGDLNPVLVIMKGAWGP